jgi:hypothetical protein
MNTIIMATLIVSQALGVNVVVTDVTRRSDLGSKIADDLYKGKTNTVWEFQGQGSRKMVAPEALLEWVRNPSKDNMNLGYRILEELKTIGVRGIVKPFRPPFWDPSPGGN